MFPRFIGNEVDEVDDKADDEENHAEPHINKENIQDKEDAADDLAEAVFLLPHGAVFRVGQTAVIAAAKDGVFAHQVTDALENTKSKSYQRQSDKNKAIHICHFVLHLLLFIVT